MAKGLTTYVTVGSSKSIGSSVVSTHSPPCIAGVQTFNIRAHRSRRLWLSCVKASFQSHGPLPKLMNTQEARDPPKQVITLYNVTRHILVVCNIHWRVYLRHRHRRLPSDRRREHWKHRRAGQLMFHRTVTYHRNPIYHRTLLCHALQSVSDKKTASEVRSSFASTNT